MIATLNVIAELHLAKISPLSPENQRQFFTKLEQLLRSCLVWDKFFVPNPDTKQYPSCPISGSPEQLEWDRLSKSACCWIISADGEEHYSTCKPYQEKGDPVGMLKALRERYQILAFPWRVKRLTELILFQRNPNEDYHSVFRRLEDIVKDIQMLTPEGTTPKQFLEELALVIVLSTIDPSHPFRIWISNNRDLTYESFKSAVEFYEDSNIDPAISLRKAPVVSIFSDPIATEVTSATSVSSPNTCFFCHSAGHRVEMCRIVKHYQREWFNSRSPRNKFPYIAPPSFTEPQPSAVLDRRASKGHGRRTSD